jgi:hypothetical protein
MVRLGLLRSLLDPCLQQFQWLAGDGKTKETGKQNIGKRNAATAQQQGKQRKIISFVPKDSASIQHHGFRATTGLTQKSV